MRQDDISLHVKGASKFVGDLDVPANTLYANVLTSTVANGIIISIDYSAAEACRGVHAIITHKDIPGLNEIGNIIKDEELFAVEQVHFIGMPIAAVIAETDAIARKAKNLIKVEYEELPAIFDPREAFAKNSLIAPPRIFSLGDVNAAWNECDFVIEDKVESGAQEHLYLETQSAVTIPIEERKFKVISSTQSPTAVQKTIAWILNIPMHMIEVEVLRLGGAFGGKEDQATPWAAITAVAANKIKRPVKLVLKRGEDIRQTGKRHPYSSDYKIGLKKDGTILGYEVTFYQNAGASADLSTAILERTLFHTTNSYFIPNVKATAVSCKTNLTPNTAYRGFGGPQAMFVLQSAIDKAADVTGLPVEDIQRKNLIKKNDTFPYGMRVMDNHAIACWDRGVELYHYGSIKKSAEKYNKISHYIKKGVSIQPVCFGISFTSTFLNQASALVHVYNDGSVLISTGAVEMGQGVNEKIKRVAANVFSLPMEMIKLDYTNTTRNANTSPTAASSGADMNGNAAKLACEEIAARLLKFAGKKLSSAYEDEVSLKNGKVFLNETETELTWKDLILSAYFERINLSAHAHYSTPNIFFDKKTEKGNAFAYHVTGTAITEVTVDCLRGTYQIDKVSIVHDYGVSLNEKIDLGQVEGALAQGIGWMTMEEILHNDKGRLTTDTLSAYKVPDIHSAPKEINVDFYNNPENSAGPFNSKAIGEPPFMYGIGTYFAILNAMKSFNPKMDFIYKAPMTPEKVLMSLLKSGGEK
ncbi:MAG: molybdopterin-dependent oxidoreductase [Bacteroidetes bacterium]|nr:molybdopterin-dependent oxidoreductase [Bacteroidota bacterium]